MQPHQRSNMNNQTDTGANEKGTPGAGGRTTGGAPDHTYQRGATRQQGQPGSGPQDGWQSGAAPGTSASGSAQPAAGADLPGGSMQTQQSGGSGAQQGITDSHQQQMTQRSGEQDAQTPPTGRQAAPHGGQRDGGMAEPRQTDPGLNPQDPRQPGLQGGSLGRAGAASQTGTAPHGAGDAPAGNLQQADSHLTGAHNAADLHGAERGVHASNDVGGGYPRSPGGANRLAADEKMDDDTGLSNPRR